MNEYFDLLKEWCDRLLSLQVTEFQEKEFYGGIMCPSCGRIHGRCRCHLSHDDHGGYHEG